MDGEAFDNARLDGLECSHIPLIRTATKTRTTTSSSRWRNECQQDYGGRFGLDFTNACSSKATHKPKTQPASSTCHNMRQTNRTNSMRDTERSSTQTSTGKQDTTSNQGKQEQRDNHDNANHNQSCFQKNGGTAQQEQTDTAN
jgi:hypothetical protein